MTRRQLAIVLLSLVVVGAACTGTVYFLSRVQLSQDKITSIVAAKQQALLLNEVKQLRDQLAALKVSLIPASDQQQPMLRPAIKTDSVNESATANINVQAKQTGLQNPVIS